MIDRYTLPEMGEIWSDERKFRTWLEVETVVAEVEAEMGIIPKEAASVIRSKGDFEIKRIDEIEKETNHDVIAFLTNVGEHVGEEGRYLHYGMTSSDLLDTSLGMLMREAGLLIADDLRKLEEVIAAKARKYKETLMVGRTHGIHAELITFGLKLAIWLEEIRRHRRRWDLAVEDASTGKISGAVGTYSHLDPGVEPEVCRRLGLKAANVSNQIVQRDRHGFYLSVLAGIASSLEKFAVEVRHLQRTEVGEVQEHFGKGQKGSSAMPHKKNPILSERISGMARIVRGNAMAALENIALWHERDISHSSVERVIIPDSTIIVNYCLRKFASLLEKLVVNEDRMKENINTSYGLVYSQGVLLALVEAGKGREEAYKIVQRTAMKAWNEKIDFRKCLSEDGEVNKTLPEEVLSGCFNEKERLSALETIFNRLGIDYSIINSISEGNLEKKKLLYEGKAKKVYLTGEEGLIIQEFKDSATAGDGAKKGTIKGKGEINNQISCFLFDYLKSYGILTHYEKKLSSTSMLIKQLEMFKVEVVMRNVAAGSLVRRYGLEEGDELKQPVLEYYLKEDALHDPMINGDHAVAFGLVTAEQLSIISKIARKINAILKDFFLRRRIILVDFKLEFGEKDGAIILGDEISPDTCRFWDSETKEKLDKDRFRQDIGGIEEAYIEMRDRILGK